MRLRVAASARWRRLRNHACQGCCIRLQAQPRRQSLCAPRRPLPLALISAAPLPPPAGQLRWALLATLSGHHPRTIFSVDWSCGGLIATGGADNAIRVFGEAGGGASGAVDEEAAAAAADAAAAEPSLRGLFMQPQQAQQQLEQQEGGSGGGGSFRLLCTRERAHPLDINCVRWHPTDPTLLASAGDDGCIRLWRWSPGRADAMEA